MKKRIVIPLLLLVVLAAIVGGLPALLRAMPSRYVARLPEPLQQLGVRGDGAAILPTVVATANLSLLLPATSETRATAVAPPPTLIPPSLTNEVASPPKPTATATTPPTATPIPIPTAFRLTGVQHQFQTWNNCGPATTAMALSTFGLYLNQSETAPFLKPNPEDRNVSPYEIVRYVNEQTPYAALDRANGTLETVKRLVAAGLPVMIELGIEPPGEYRWLGWYGHYLLIVAYDDALQQFWVYDSWFGTSDVPMENADVNGRILAYTDADQQWQQFNRSYIVFYQPEAADQVSTIIGDDMEDAIMWQKALNRTNAELAREPENAFLWFNLGTIYNALSDYDRAATAFDQARAIGLPWRMLWYQFGPYEAYYQVSRLEDVILLADVTLQDRPYFEESFYHKGLALAAQGDPKAARTQLEKAATFNPYFQPAVTALNQG